MQTSIYTPTDWLNPFNWNHVFADGSRPLEIDIGCGKGGFLLWAAATRPQHNFLGVERQLVRVRKVDKKILRAKLANSRLLRIEVSYFVEKLVPDASVAAYHILFPDPWPKRRHEGNRLFQPAFVRELHRTLGKGGAVNVATDDLEYFEAIQKVMRASGLYREEPADVLPVEAQTEFEKIFLAAGKKIGRAKYFKL